MNKFGSQFHRKFGCRMRVNAATKTITRFQQRDLHSGLGKMTRGSQPGNPTADD
jgi:hypothetical protein